MTLTFRKPSQQNFLLWLLILYPFLFGTLNDLLGLPWALRYSADVAWCMLLLLMLRFHEALDFQPVQYLLIWALLFLSFTALVYPVVYQSALYYLWGFRNQFRFYVAFFAFATMLTQDSAGYFLKRMDQLFWLNAAAHYTWMSYTMVYLETGYVGLIFYFGFFLGCFASAAKAARRPGANLLFCRMAQIMALCCVLIGIYNSSLRGESGYMAYFILALPYAATPGRQV